MLFDSPVYVLFLAAVVSIYWRFGRKGQNRLLLAASYFFYGWWDYRFLGLILLSTIVDYYCAIGIEDAANERRRRTLMAVSVTMNLVFLGYFKYFNFFADSLHVALGTIGIETSPRVLNILLPPGISFYTFQAVAYMVDVYYRRLPASRSLTEYALFISLFPHLIAGPIQRPGHLLPQVAQDRTFDPSSSFDGVMLILTGLFRKVVVADSCATIANAAFSGALGEQSLGVLLVGAYAFAWQIYGDFSGYSDIARGSAQLIGFHFMVNFRQPYLASSLQDFWRRWHISLSTWLRDYLYIPLGGSRGSESKTQRNLFLTMLLGGLWHGANWTFVIWGAIHGSWLAAERKLRAALPAKDRDVRDSVLSLWAKRIVIFHIVCAAWIFFRAESVHKALAMFSGATSLGWNHNLTTAMLVVAVYAVPLFALDLMLERSKEEFPSHARPVAIKFATAVVLLGIIGLFSANEASTFIYFQF